MDFTKAKAAVMTGVGKVEMREATIPRVTDDSIVVKTKYSGISTGTEMRLYNGFVKQIGLDYPLIPGYEGVGEVVYVGRDVSQFQLGDRVMANEVYKGYPGYTAAWGGQVEYLVVGPDTQFMPADQWALPIPDLVSYEEAVVAQLAGVALKGCDKIPVREGQIAVVTGQGVVGISAAQFLKMKGARVIVTDLHDSRLAVGGQFVDYTINASKEDVVARVREITGGKMADILFEATGNAEAAGQAIALSNDSALLHFQSAYTEPVVFPDFIWFTHSARRMQGSLATTQPHKKRVLEMIATGTFDARCMITTVRPIDDAPQSYTDVRDHKDTILKLLFAWE